jgi:hypothetical protein
LRKIDTNHKGQVTKNQLERALEDPSFTGQQAQVLGAMESKFDGLHNLSHHEGWFQNQSISSADLDQFQRIRNEFAKKQADATAIEMWQDLLPSFSRNGKNLTREDIEVALESTGLTADTREVLQSIKRNYDAIAQPGEGGISKKDCEDYFHAIQNDKETQLVEGVESACAQIAERNRAMSGLRGLYATPNLQKNIRPEDIQQGSIGDCYFEASLAAVAYAEPRTIAQAIADNHDGTYTVTFAGAKDERITVTAPTEAEIGLYNGGIKDGLWAGVMEKAYGQFRINQDPPWVNRPGVPEEGADGGGYPEDVLPLLTGHQVEKVQVQGDEQSEQKLTERLARAFQSPNKKAVTASILGDASADTREPGKTPDGLYERHAYTVTGIKLTGPNDGTVTIRNPAGGLDGTVYGTMTIPLEMFMRNFNYVTIED